MHSHAGVRKRKGMIAPTDCSRTGVIPKSPKSGGLKVLFVGGGTVALADSIRDWFPNQAVAEHPAFANARGMLKYLRFVCEVPV